MLRKISFVFFTLSLMFLAKSYTHKKPKRLKLVTVDSDRLIEIVGDINRLKLKLKGIELENVMETGPGPVYLLINSSGGSVQPTLTFIDRINNLKAQGTPVFCITGTEAMSAALYMLDSCSVRYILPSAQIMWHPIRTRNPFQPLEGIVLDAAIMFEKEKELLETMRRNMGLNEDVFYSHYVHETVWPATVLAKQAPDYFTIVSGVVGAPKLFESGR